MSITAKCEGKGVYAGLVSRLRTKGDVDRVMTGIANSIARRNSVSWDDVLSVQNFYARRFYRYSRFPEVKEALVKYFCVEGC